MSGTQVLIVMDAHWPRALLLAALREAGYDARGTANLKEAVAWSAGEGCRMALGLIILDHHVSGDDLLLPELLRGHPQARTLFLRSALRPAASECPGHVLRYPTSIAEILRSVQELLPPKDHV